VFDLSKAKNTAEDQTEGVEDEDALDPEKVELTKVPLMIANAQSTERAGG